MRRILLIMLVSLLFSACAPSPMPTPKPKITSYKAEYRVSGTAKKVSLTFSNAQGGTEQTYAYLPWHRSLSVKEGHFLYLSAQNQGESGSVTVEIRLNGQAWKKASSSGAYVIASCSGLAGLE